MSNVIKAVRNLRGFTQEDVAKRLGMASRTFCKKESNPETFTVGEIKRLAEILGVEEGIFFSENVTVKVTNA